MLKGRKGCACKICRARHRLAPRVVATLSRNAVAVGGDAMIDSEGGDEGEGVTLAETMTCISFDLI